jgi:hypothetical protein
MTSVSSDSVLAIGTTAAFSTVKENSEVCRTCQNATSACNYTKVGKDNNSISSLFFSSIYVSMITVEKIYFLYINTMCI